MDLEKGLIRALHKESFKDDPTRMFRAVRFEQRFGYVLEGFGGVLGLVTWIGVSPGVQ